MDDEEELSDAVQYLHHQGTLLHFTDQALKDVYFLDPQWLCKMMASVIRVPPAGEESIVKNGMCFIGKRKTHVVKPGACQPQASKRFHEIVFAHEVKLLYVCMYVCMYVSLPCGY